MLPILLDDLETCLLNKADLKSLDFISRRSSVHEIILSANNNVSNFYGRPM